MNEKKIEIDDEVFLEIEKNQFTKDFKLMIFSMVMALWLMFIYAFISVIKVIF
jgi:hypothetical protein